MVILGIDYGRSKIGFSLAEGSIAYPLKVIKVISFKEAIKTVKDVVYMEKAQKVVVGISEGEMAKEELKFVQELKKELTISVTTWDETLTTQDAQKLSLEAGLSKKRRKAQEDAFSSTVMLQSYLDSNETES